MTDGQKYLWPLLAIVFSCFKIKKHFTQLNMWIISYKT